VHTNPSVRRKNMRLIQFGPPGQEKPGILFAEGVRKDLSGSFSAWNSEFFRDSGLVRLSNFLRSVHIQELPEVAEPARWGAPVARPGKIVCIGLNYSEHAAESRKPLPTEPIIFLKAPNAMVGPYDHIEIPAGSRKTDWEIELGVVIGREARYLQSPDDSNQCIAGYCISHDVSERSFQVERGGQWTKGKSCDTFNPLGPWVATPDELPHVGSLNMSLRVNGEIKQKGNTSTMIFNVSYLVWYVSQFMTLEPGDLISTGTPAGVGTGMTPPQFLKIDDVLELEIDGLGRQRQKCVPHRRSS
jgi:2,4-didehydro-3-deoxy-L-rhamnonate hydrolase